MMRTYSSSLKRGESCNQPVKMTDEYLKERAKKRGGHKIKFNQNARMQRQISKQLKEKRK